MDATEMVAVAREPAAATDEETCILAWNAALEGLTGYRRDQVLKTSLVEVLHPRDVYGNAYALPGDLVRAMLLRGEAPRPFDVQITMADGSTRFSTVSLIVFVAEGSRLQLVLHFMPHRHQAPLQAPVWSDAADLTQLTSREREVLTLLARTSSKQAVATRLHISVHTVRRHVQNILGKLDVHSQHEAVARALRAGLI